MLDMISMVVPLSVGNALRVFLVPPSTALSWRVLRKGADTFTGHDDAQATLVYQGDEPSVLDSALLTNGSTYYYRAYYWSGMAWSASATVSAVPAASYQDASTDAPSIVRDRLDAGMQVEVSRGTLRPESGGIAVLNAPPEFGDIRWPLLTVHLQNEAPAVRGIGEVFAIDDFDSEEGEWRASEGWLSRVTLAVVAWSQNPDERAELRRALRRLLIANLPVFEAEGLINVEFQMQDIDFVSGEFPALVYQVMCTFTCLAPAAVRTTESVISEVQFTIAEE